MKNLKMVLLAGSALCAATIAGCASTPQVNREASTSAITQTTTHKA